MGWYRAGSVSVTVNSRDVAGQNVDFVSNVLSGAIFFGPDGGAYEVESVVSATVLRLVTQYKGATVANAAYAIAQTQSYILQLAQSATTLLNTFGSFRDAYNNGDLVGKGLALKGILTSTANLPTEGMVVGDAYLIGTVLNVWSGSVWKTSDIQGAKGDQGIQGIKGDTGATGPANVLSVGTVTSGATPSATISGTTPNQVLSLVLQKGDKGDKGEQGIQGPAGNGSLNSVSAILPLSATSGTDPVLSLLHSASTTYTYNTDNKITSYTETIGGVTFTTTLTYNTDGTVHTIGTSGNGKTRTETYAYSNGTVTGMSATEI